MIPAPHASLIWHHAPFGRRVMNPDSPSFVISGPIAEDRESLRRRALIELAGLR